LSAFPKLSRPNHCYYLLTDLEPGQKNKSQTLAAEIFMMQLTLLTSNGHYIQEEAHYGKPDLN
jgi:hypothetical protein